jgi:hypothetical protein
MKTAAFGLLIGCILITTTSFSRNGSNFSKDSLKVRFSHFIGVGSSRTPSSNKPDGRSLTSVDYNNPEANLFYRCLLDYNPYTASAVSINFFNRGGHYYQRGYGSTYDGNFEFVKWSIGISQFARIKIGRRVYLNLGGGTEIGGLVYSNGNIKVESFDPKNGVSYGTANIDRFLNDKYLSINTELNIGIKINSKRCLILGVKQYIERADLDGTRRNLTSNCFIAFKL